MSQPLGRISETMQRAGAALGEACTAVADLIVAMGQFMAEVLSLLPETMTRKAALSTAPPRVRYLAEHGKKYRTRKKNLNRALKDYEKRRRHDRATI